MIIHRNVILNPKYNLYNDLDRVLIMSSSESDVLEKGVLQFLHPNIAILLSFFSGEDSYDDAIAKICHHFQITEGKAIDIVSLFINNPNAVGVKYNHHTFILPSYTLIDNPCDMTRKDLNINDFHMISTLNFDRKRLSYPKNIAICINLSCVTNCTYCYANRAHNYTPITTTKLIHLITEAAKLRVRDINFTGGEFFLHKDWLTLIQTLIANGYNPEISTKVPLSHEMIDQAKQVGIKCIQFSLDTLDADVVCASLNVSKDYTKKIEDAITYADNVGLEIVLKPTLINTTCNIENITNILNFAKRLKHMRRMVISTASYSMFKGQECYKQIRASDLQATQLYQYVDSILSEYNFPIIQDDQLCSEDDFANQTVFDSRSLCSANLDGFIVLPDGKVTICEGLYWHPEFILGDIKSMSIMEVWNSKRALELANSSQNNFPDHSHCSKCSDFVNCHTSKGVCWKMVLEAYGEPYLPDPRCPYAPKLKYNIIGK